MYRSRVVVCLGLVFLVGIFVTGASAQQAKRNQKQAARANQQDQAAANVAQNPAVQMLLQQFDKNGNGVLEGEELLAVATAMQQLLMARAAANGGAMGGVQGAGGQMMGNQAGAGRGFGAMGQGFGAAGQGFGEANGGNQNRFQRGPGAAGGNAPR